MNINNKTRRTFLKNSAIGLAGASIGGLLSSCASFDDYLFDDKSSLNEEVVIIGGGISGLYLAHKLRTKQVEFKLFEASPSLGGRIKSSGGHDFGASLFSKKDLLFNALIEDLHINKVTLDKESYFISEGMERVIIELKERILGLLPYRNFRLRWQLIEIQKLNADYELTFQLAQGQKKVRCKRLAIAIPPSQWGRVKGLLDLPEMEVARSLHSNLKTENIIKLVLPSGAIPNSARAISQIEMGDFLVRQVVKNHHNSLPVELDILHSPNINFSIDYIYGELKKKLQINYPFQKLANDQFYNWQQAVYLQGAYFKLDQGLKIDKKSNFQLIGDSVATISPNRLEGALQTALAAAEAFI